MTDLRQPLAILYQALPPPEIDGLRKDAKPGGYSDSGADIGFCLKARGLEILTPVPQPDPMRPMDWVFPDTAEGIEDAISRGAAVLWVNTVVFIGHPIERVMASHWIVGQHPAAQQAGDDKFATNDLLRANGLPLPTSLLAARTARPGIQALDDLRAAGLTYPLIVKPIRGRGSQGVARVANYNELLQAAISVIDSARFGDTIMIEQYLGGAEMTVTVLPSDNGYIALPPVLRFNHQDGVAPYNGVVAVTHNSRALTREEQNNPAVAAMMDHCVTAARVMQSRAPIRIDCRGDGSGVMRLFDLNMKPNLTGAGRPGRDDQDSLSTIAARAMGWSYGDLLSDMLAHAWKAPR